MVSMDRGDSSYMTPSKLISATIVLVDSAGVHFRESTHQTVLFCKKSRTEDNVIVILYVDQQKYQNEAARSIRRKPHG